jgi:dipeptidyl-peptidase 4
MRFLSRDLNLTRFFVFVLSGLIVLGGAVQGRGASPLKPLTIDAITKDGVILSRGVSALQWTPDGKSLTYLKPRLNDEKEARQIIGFDLEKRSERVIWDAGENQEKFSLGSYQWSPRGDQLLLTGGNDLWLITPTHGGKKRLTRDAVEKEYPTFSPTGEFIAYHQKGNLFVLSLRTGKVQPLTRDGDSNILNGRLDWVYEEELADRRSGRSYEWSPDGRKIAYLRLDQSPVPLCPITDYMPLHPSIEQQRYPKSGDPNSIPTVHIVTVEGRSKHYSFPLLGDGRKEGNSSVEYVGPAFSWTPDSAAVAVLTLNRAQNELKVHLWKPGEKQATVLLTEKDDYWINSLEPPRFLKDGRFLWMSERSGWMHLYLYDAIGKLIRPATQGEWMVDGEIGVDAAEKNVFFVSNKTNFIERQIQRLSLESGAVTAVTKEPGTHQLKISPDGSWILDQFSSLEIPPQNRLLQTDGTEVGRLPQAPSHLDEFQLAKNELLALHSPDGAQLLARLVKPSHFDSGRMYPVIISVYGGPHVQTVSNRWGGTSLFEHFLAEQGFLVWSLDNRGSYGRGHAWESVIFKNLGKMELADQLAGVDYLKGLPFVDGQRIGIWGGSYGGYMTLYSLTYAPGIFNCGISLFPVTDWKFYDSIYTERYMQMPAENPEGYKNNSPLARASDLKDSLLLIHGTADNNVHLQNSMQMINALIKARRQFELQIYPGQRHGIHGESLRLHLNDMVFNYFKKQLSPAGPQP